MIDFNVGVDADVDADASVGGDVSGGSVSEELDLAIGSAACRVLPMVSMVATVTGNVEATMADSPMSALASFLPIGETFSNPDRGGDGGMSSSDLAS